MTNSSPTWQLGPTHAPPPPFVRTLPLVGIGPSLRRDPLACFLRLYQQHGEVFRLNLLLGREITVLAGLDANRFLNSDGNQVLTSEVLFGGFGRQMRTKTILVAMDGPDHLHLRKIMRRGYSRSAMTPHLGRLVALVDEFTGRLQAGQSFALLPWLQRLVTQQLGVIIARQTPDDYFEDLQVFLNVMLKVEVLRTYPRWMLRSPRYQKARQRGFELARHVLAAHRDQPALPEDERDLIDDLLTARDSRGQAYSEDMLIAATLGPYFAGIDTVASSLAFFIYNVLTHPEVLEAATAEADALFAKGLDDLHALQDLETLHGAAIESLRMYPVAPFTPRTASQTFEFKGYRIEARSELFFLQTLTHYLPEFFPDPYRFDPQRFAKGQGKGIAGAFAPYTLGAHLCLGAGIAETQMMLIMARLLHTLRLDLPDPRLTIYASPLPNVGRRFQARVLEKRHI